MSQLLRQATLLSFILFFAASSAQKKVLDSLNARLATHLAKDADRVHTLLRVADRITTTNPDKALALTSEAQALATEIDDKKGKAYSLLYASNARIAKGQWQTALAETQKSMAVFESMANKYGMADCYHNYARCQFYLGQYDKAITNYKTAVSLGEETNDLGRQSSSLNALGVVYTRQGERDKAMEVLQRALEIDKRQKGNTFGISSDYANIGTLLTSKGDYAEALEYYFKALELKRQINDKRGIAAVMGNIGMVYSELRKNPEALDYHTKAAEIWEEVGNRAGLATSYNNIGIIYMNEGQFPEARGLFIQALAINTELKSQHNVALAHTNLGTLDLYCKDYPSALSHFEKAEAIHKKLKSRRELSYAYLKMGKIFRLTGKYDKALEYADMGDAIAKELGLLDHQRDFSQLRSDIYLDQKNYKLAYENQAKHKILADSILANDVYGNVADVKYNNVYKEKLNSSKNRENSLKDEVLSKEDELQESEQQKVWWIAGAFCLLALLGLGIAWYKVRKVKMENKQLLTEQKLRRSQMNPHFIFNSIQNVRSLIHNKQQDQAVDYLNQFSKLTRQILESSDENYTSLEDEIELIKNYISIQQLLYNNAFDFEINVDDSIDPESIFLPPMLTQPFIENAIKHGLASKAADGMLTIDFKLKDDKLYFEVSDNGLGFNNAKKAAGHKSMAMDITRERLVNYTKNPDFEVHAGNIFDRGQNVIGAKVAFEIPYIYEN